MIRGKVHDLNFKEYVTIGDDVTTSVFCEVDDIISENKVGSDDDSNLDDTSATVENEVPSRNEALEAINLLRRYMAAAPHASSDVSANVNRWRVLFSVIAFQQLSKPRSQNSLYR